MIPISKTRSSVSWGLNIGTFREVIELSASFCDQPLGLLRAPYAWSAYISNRPSHNLRPRLTLSLRESRADPAPQLAIPAAQPIEAAPLPGARRVCYLPSCPSL